MLVAGSESTDVAWQMTVINLQSLALSGATSILLERLGGRERPYALSRRGTSTPRDLAAELGTATGGTLGGLLGGLASGVLPDAGLGSVPVQMDATVGSVDGRPRVDQARAGGVVIRKDLAPGVPPAPSPSVPTRSTRGKSPSFTATTPTSTARNPRICGSQAMPARRCTVVTSRPPRSCWWWCSAPSSPR